MLKSIFLVFVAALVAGCAGGLSSVAKSPTAELAVKYATINLIQQSSHVTASRVIENVHAARELLHTDASIGIAGLAASVRENVRWERLQTADALLLDQLLSEAERRLTERVGEGLLDHDHRVLVSEVLSWIEAAANMAAPRSMAGAFLVASLNKVWSAERLIVWFSNA